MLLQQSMQQNALMLQMMSQRGGGSGGMFSSPQPSAGSLGLSSPPAAAPEGTFLVQTIHPWKKLNPDHASDISLVGTMLTAVAQQPWPRFVRVVDNDRVVRCIGADYVQRGALSRCSDGRHHLTASRSHSSPLLFHSDGATITAATADGGAAVAATTTGV